MVTIVTVLVIDLGLNEYVNAVYFCCISSSLLIEIGHTRLNIKVIEIGFNLTKIYIIFGPIIYLLVAIATVLLY